MTIAETLYQIDIDAFGASDVGKERPTNEDRYLVASTNNSLVIHGTNLETSAHTRLIGRPRGEILVVADGMGGHPGGEIASRIAVETIVSYVLNILEMPVGRECDESDEVDSLKKILENCRREIKKAALHKGEEFKNMGTTLTMAYCIWPTVYVIHAGDCRCYILRSGTLTRITTDHTMAQGLVDRGVIEEDEARENVWNNVVTNVISGGDDRLDPDVYKGFLEPGDKLLLCTDGLTAHVDDDEIKSALDSDLSPEEASNLLVHSANAKGGKDNVTVLIAEFKESVEKKERVGER